MPPPPKAKLHRTTGRLKNLNNSNENSSSNISHVSGNNRPANSSNSNANVPNSGSNNVLGLENLNNPTESSAIEQFELELYWCIQTLENSLNSGKLNPKQVQDADKTLRSLKSSSQPMVKKRQLMQSTFGDYRKKMTEEEKKLRVGNKSIQFIAGTSKDAKTQANKSHFVKKSFTTTFGNSDFRFNFPIKDMQKLSIEQSDPTNDVHASDDSIICESTSIDDDDKANADNSTQNQNECDRINKLEDASKIAQSNPFIQSKLHTSDNAFRFNFSVQCD